MRRLLIGSFVFAAVVSFAGAGRAHITLTSPAPRHGPDQQKVSPCGARGDARGEAVTVFEPGETITVAWDETIDHPGHFRIMFDDDGFDDFPEPADEFDLCEPGVDQGCLLDGIEDKRGGSYSVQVTLPEIECEHCTLQLIQVMTDRKPATLYYACADLALRSSGEDPGAATSSSSAGAGGGAATGAGGGAATSSSSGAATGSGGGAATSSSSSAATGAGGGAATSSSSSAATGAGEEGVGGSGPGSGGDDGGCSFGGAGGAPAPAALALAALGAVAARRRRRALP
ncbi:SCE4755 family polysaccharide monooxygenase-like protein [Sorangium sp. So ce1036]|uniref:SCE4755 family polysaccharide monooxygenase-like protein n=1 Tax=Sorangium sp. So ce1036 TaxID=3133328 RepID=UPI003F08B8B3